MKGQEAAAVGEALDPEDGVDGAGEVFDAEESDDDDSEDVDFGSEAGRDDEDRLSVL